MTMQFAFFVILYLLGLWFGLLFKDRVPMSFIILSGFLWGSVFWVLVSLLLLLIPIAYSAESAGLSLLIVFLVIGGLHYRKKTWTLSLRELGFVAIAILMFGGIAAFFVQNNLAIGFTDGISMIAVGESMATHGFTHQNIDLMALVGVFVPMVHAAAVFVGEQYLFSFQPVLSVSFVLVFVYICFRGVSQALQRTWLVGSTVLIITIGMMTTYLITYQALSIHANLPSAIYLFAAVGCFWLTLRDENTGWLPFGILALIGFSLLRTEAPLFGLVVIMLMFGLGSLLIVSALFMLCHFWLSSCYGIFSLC